MTDEWINAFEGTNISDWAYWGTEKCRIIVIHQQDWSWLLPVLHPLSFLIGIALVIWALGRIGK